MKAAAKAAAAGAAVVFLLPVLVLLMFVGSAKPPDEGFVCSAVAAGAPASPTTTTTGPAPVETGALGGGAPEQLGPDGTPLIIGRPVISAAAMYTWYATHSAWATRVGPGQVPVRDVIGTYYVVGAAEGVRPDLAFIQAAFETGGFENSDARRINNFAGVAHYDDLAISGTGWATAEGGVTGHVQLLRRYAQGNTVALALPDQTVTAGASTTTFGGLSGTWASDTTYWTKITSLYQRAGGTAATGPLCEPTAAPAAPAAPSPIAARGGGDDGRDPPLAYVQGIPVAATVEPQVTAMIAAAASEGVELTIGNSYRSIDKQIELRKAHCGTSTYAIYEASSSSCTPPTARPGQSEHQKGLAIDFGACSTRSTACYQWLAGNAQRFGFLNLPSEAWHWSTTGS